MFDGFTGDGFSGGDFPGGGLPDHGAAGARAAIGVLTEMVEMGRELAGADVAAGSDDELFDAAVALEALGSLVATTSAHVLAELDARDACDTTFGLGTARWVAREARVAVGPVRSRLRVGRALRTRLCEVDRALRAGGSGDGVGAVLDGIAGDETDIDTLSFDHAKALVDATNPRVVELIADLQPEIIALAVDRSFETWKAHVNGLVALIDQDGTEPDDLSVNSLSVTSTIDGLCHIKGTLTADVGLAVRSALDAKADELFRRFTSDAEVAAELEVPSRSTLRALALAEITHLAMGCDRSSGSVPRAEVTLVAHNHEITDSEGHPLPRASTDVWGCDAEIWAVVVDEMGIPVDMGHVRRLATLAQRKAIAVRDGGCVFPGCDAPIDWCDMHHLQHWNDGGTTDVANMVALCRHHHGVAHRKGWLLHLSQDHRTWWRSASGNAFWGQQHLRRRSDPPPDGCTGCAGCQQHQT